MTVSARVRRNQRPATAYAAVIGASALTTVIGLAALTAVRVEGRITNDSADFTKAMFYARSAVEKGVYLVKNDANWRSNRSNGVWESNTAIGDGTYTLEGRDPIDSILGNVLQDPLWLIGTGAARNARYKLRVELEPVGGGYTCLEVPFHSANTLTFNNATVTSDGPISCNRGIAASGSLITANLEAVNGITGGIIVGTKTSPITARVMPDAVFDFYGDATRATAIDVALLPKYSGDRAIQDVTLSPTNNPYGAANPQGLYTIDCGGGRLVIRNARIIGTLAVLNAAQVTLRDSVNWDKTSYYPSLLVQGPLSLEISATNFLLGLDLLPSVLKGLFYASSGVTISNNVAIVGVLVSGGTSSVGGTLSLTYNSAFLNNPPPGFGTPKTMDIVEGSWQRLVN